MSASEAPSMRSDCRLRSDIERVQRSLLPRSLIRHLKTLSSIGIRIDQQDRAIGCSNVLRRATMGRMKTVTHREMRNRSGEILCRVEAGESVQVTNNGHLAAVIVPAGGDPLDGLIARGGARPARTGTDALAAITRVASPVSSRELLDDSRGRW